MTRPASLTELACGTSWRLEDGRLEVSNSAEDAEELLDCPSTSSGHDGVAKRLGPWGLTPDGEGSTPSYSTCTDVAEQVDAPDCQSGPCPSVKGRTGLRVRVPSSVPSGIYNRKSRMSRCLCGKILRFSDIG